MDFDDLCEYEPSEKSPIYSLWLRVFSVSFFELQAGKHSPAGQSFLFDRDNVFFDLIADGLNIEPVALRKRIKVVIEQARPAPKVSLRGKNRRRAGS